MSLTGMIRQWQRSRAQIHELEMLGAGELQALARDNAISEQALVSLAARGPEAGAELSRMMEALSLESAAITRKNPALMRDMAMVCSMCGEVARCRRSLDAGQASADYSGFCPNAESLQELQGRAGV